MASSVWDNLQLSAVSILDRARVELENSKLGLNWTLVVLVVLSVIPALVLRTWLSGRLPPSPDDHVIALLASFCTAIDTQKLLMKANLTLSLNTIS